MAIEPKVEVLHFVSMKLNNKWDFLTCLQLSSSCPFEAVGRMTVSPNEPQ